MYLAMMIIQMSSEAYCQKITSLQRGGEMFTQQHEKQILRTWWLSGGKTTR
jgi:hypothetical protein